MEDDILCPVHQSKTADDQGFEGLHFAPARPFQADPGRGRVSLRWTFDRQCQNSPDLV